MTEHPSESDTAGVDAPPAAGVGVEQTPERAPGDSSADGPEHVRSASRRPAWVGLAFGALGVVYGDIGTSPLYSLKTVFSLDHSAVTPSRGDVYGVISLVFWAITVVVSVKYVVFILRADNDGEGGIMALAALLRRATARAGPRLIAVAMILGVIGASLFYGDSLITPAISVLSAIEGLEVVSPDLSDLVLPLGIAVLVVLFVVQRFGTHLVGRFFGPVMVLWFVVLGAAGIPHIVSDPGVLRALSPSYAVAFFVEHVYIAFIAMGAVVLVITGAEALYADMGHFGRSPIRRAWFALVFPALTLNYFGQGALILRQPSAISNPFYLLVPSWARVPMVVLSTVATVIASQAVISGAYSVSRQAVRLGYLPHLTVRHTSQQESGQIYVPAVNWLLFGGVLVLIVGFRSSDRLATAYGLAVTGTLLLTTTLFLMVARYLWRWRTWQIVIVGVVFGGIELTFFAANLTKVVHGGWLPLLVAVVVVTSMMTWQRGRKLITERRRELEGPLSAFVQKMHDAPVERVRGTAVFPHPNKETTPLALRANVRFNRVLHEHIVIVSIVAETIPHVPIDERVTVDNLDHLDDGIVHLQVRFGFQDEQDIPATLRRLSQTKHRMPSGEAVADGGAELNVDTAHIYYFLSRITIQRGPEPGMATWRKRLFIGLAHNAANPAEYFRLPVDRTVVMGSHVDL